ncbi:MAG: PLP-dependent aminotransferase family protein [Kangiellaceae bacterium]|nr:PLP-dependent aminotransferase family protein [Kangiellaceae bacterium]
MQKFVYHQLVEQIEHDIRSGILRCGEKIASINQLKQQSGLSKNTVIRALEVLEAKGQIEAKPRVGYYVCALETIQRPSLPNRMLNQPKEVSVPKLFSEIMEQGSAFDIYPQAEVPANSNHLVNLNRHISRSMRIQSTHKALYYEQPQGDLGLRREISSRYRRVDLNIDELDICITSGCQHALFLALLASCQAGDNVAVESPAFYGVLQLLEQLKLNIVEIPTDPAHGIYVDSLEEICQRWKISAVILTPAFATPSGACVSKNKRQSIIDIANQYYFAIIEDDIYGELGFTDRPSPLKCLDTQDRVILCSSFSKSLSKELRTGWIAAGRWHDKVINLKLVSQLAGNQSVQQGLASFLAEGHYRRHLISLQLKLRQNRDQLVSAINQQWQEKVRYHLPNGGLSLWLELNKQINTLELYQRAKQLNIFITPGALFTTTKKFDHFLRLSFIHPLVSERKQAFDRLGKLIE